MLRLQTPCYYADPLQMDAEATGDGIVVSRVTSQGPADRAGIQLYDQIVQVSPGAPLSLASCWGGVLLDRCNRRRPDVDRSRGAGGAESVVQTSRIVIYVIALSTVPRTFPAI